MSNFCCPNCGSDNTQSFPSIYESGSYSGGSTTVGTAVVGGRSAPYAGYSAHSGRTDLATRLAPPTRAGIGCGGAIAFAVTLFGAVSALLGFQMLVHGRIPAERAGGVVYLILSAFFGIPGLLIAVAAIRRQRAYNRDEYPVALRNWRSSLHCHRCGTDFVSAP